MADKVRTPEREPSPILVGRSNALVERLVKIGKARLDDLQPGEGAVQIVPKAFGNATATVVAGADAAGTDAAARRIPRAACRTSGTTRAVRYRSATWRCRLNRFLQARTAAGQASQIDTELDALAGEMQGQDARVGRREAVRRAGRSGARRICRRQAAARPASRRR